MQKSSAETGLQRRLPQPSIEDVSMTTTCVRMGRCSELWKLIISRELAVSFFFLFVFSCFHSVVDFISSIILCVVGGNPKEMWAKHWAERECMIVSEYMHVCAFIGV